MFTEESRSMTDKPIFIFAQARSGSTLVQRVLNSVDDVIIYGEHLGILEKVAQSYFEFHRSLKYLPNFCSTNENLNEVQAEALKRLRDPQDFTPHISGFSIRHVREQYAKFVSDLIQTVDKERGKRWGFKEIRYGFGDKVFEVLAQFFPQATFVFVARHPFGMLSSERGTGWIDFKLQERAQRWHQQTSSFVEYHKANPARTIFVRYEDFTDPARKTAQNLFERLGLPFGEKQRQIIFDIGKVGASPNKSDFTEDEQRRIRNWCLTPDIQEFYPC